MKAANKVLVVEDNEITRFLTEHTLLEMNTSNRLYFAKNGHEALKLLRDGLNPDLILLDLNMPRMDGFAFLEQYQQLWASSQAKIVVISTSAHQQHRQEAIRFPGVIGYAEKPITAQKLQLLLKNWGVKS